MLQYYYKRRISYETKQINCQIVSGLSGPRHRETALTSQEGIRQDLETQGRRQTIHTQMAYCKSVIQV